MTIPSNELPPAALFSEPPLISTEELEQHAHSVFRQHRPLTALVRRQDGVYVAIRSRDVDRLATDPRTRQLETEIARSRGVDAGPLFDFFKNTMLLSNGQEHRARRAPMARAFALKLITELRPRIRAIANELIDHCFARGEMSFMEDYAAWIPARILSELLGLPAADIPEFTRQVYRLAPALSSAFSREDVPELQSTADKLTRYAQKLLQERHAQPRNDFLTSYAQEISTSGALSETESLIQLVTVILGGSETTRSALTIQTSLLLQHGEQWDAVCRDSSLIPGAVLESLRFEPAVGSFARFTLEDIVIDGWLIPRNSVLSLSTLSAMRDPALYSDPDRFDIRRADHPRRHMVFGAGAHRCLGEALARAELEEGLAALAARLPGLQLVDGPASVWGSGGIRKVKGMRVGWR
jgi:cytochrome P450 family 103